MNTVPTHRYSKTALSMNRSPIKTNFLSIHFLFFNFISFPSTAIHLPANFPVIHLASQSQQLIICVSFYSRPPRSFTRTTFFSHIFQV